jgi:predicted PurR-regulated permease PerM
MRTRIHNPRSFFGYRWPAMPRDYLLRRRMFRRISNVLMVVILSILLAGVIVYTSNPGSFIPVAK